MGQSFGYYFSLVMSKDMTIYDKSCKIVLRTNIEVVIIVLPLYNELDVVLGILEKILCVLVSKITGVVVVDFGNDVASQQVLASRGAWRHLQTQYLHLNLNDDFH